MAIRQLVDLKQLGNGDLSIGKLIFHMRLKFCVLVGVVIKDCLLVQSANSSTQPPQNSHQVYFESSDVGTSLVSLSHWSSRGCQDTHTVT